MARMIPSVFDEDNKKELPAFPRTIGVVTSPTGAAIRDILNVTKRRNPGMNIIVLPAIVQERSTGQVLMLAYMNRESMQKTFETGYTWFYSRSRQELWNKGATSGHLQKVIDIKGDCDKDTLLVIVDQTGAACHTGSHSCFFNNIWEEFQNGKSE